MTPAENIEIERLIAVEINAMEVKAAEIGFHAANIANLSTDAFLAAYEPSAVNKAGDKGSALLQAIPRLKKRIEAFHLAGQAMIATASFPRPRTGK